VLGIDGFNIYNIRKNTAKEGTQTNSLSSSITLEKEKKRGSFFNNFLGKKLMGVKTKARPINTIWDIKKIDSKTIQMIFIEKNETKKVMVYQCVTVDNCSEIMAKITFLRVRYIFVNIFRKTKKSL
jgi:hypothetical protein